MSRMYGQARQYPSFIPNINLLRYIEGFGGKGNGPSAEGTAFPLSSKADSPHAEFLMDITPGESTTCGRAAAGLNGEGVESPKAARFLRALLASLPVHLDVATLQPAFTRSSASETISLPVHLDVATLQRSAVAVYDPTCHLDREGVEGSRFPSVSHCDDKVHRKGHRAEESALAIAFNRAPATGDEAGNRRAYHAEVDVVVDVDHMARDRQVRLIPGEDPESRLPSRSCKNPSTAGREIGRRRLRARGAVR
jgi:hypothetical protein